MKYLMVTDKNNIFKEQNSQISNVSFYLLIVMSTPTFDYTNFYNMPETFPDSIANNDPICHSHLPHYQVQHPLWYFEDADLFFNQRGILFGLHQQKFNNPYFIRCLQHIEPCQTAAIGTTPSLPISLDTLSITPFITFIRLLYRPFDFSTDINGWNQIKDLAMMWGFVDVMLTAMRQTQTVNSRNRSTI